MYKLSQVNRQNGLIVAKYYLNIYNINKAAKTIKYCMISQ